MSSETQPVRKSGTATECTSCGVTLDEQRLALQSYSGADDEIAGLSAGGLLYCPNCAAEPVELIDSWTAHEQPPIEADRPISAGYRQSTEECSFCTDELDTESVLGVELYRRPGEDLPAYANYTLCADCRSVFEEFLANVTRSEGR